MEDQWFERGAAGQRAGRAVARRRLGRRPGLGVAHRLTRTRPSACAGCSTTPSTPPTGARAWALVRTTGSTSSRCARAGARAVGSACAGLLVRHDRGSTRGTTRHARPDPLAAVDDDGGGRHAQAPGDWSTDDWFGAWCVPRRRGRRRPWRDVDRETDRDWDGTPPGRHRPSSCSPLRDEACRRASTAVHRRAAARGGRRLAEHVVRESRAARTAVQPALDPVPHDRGVRPSQRPRRPDPGVHRRSRRASAATQGRRRSVLYLPQTVRWSRQISCSRVETTLPAASSRMWSHGGEAGLVVVLEAHAAPLQPGDLGGQVAHLEAHRGAVDCWPAAAGAGRARAAAEPEHQAALAVLRRRTAAPSRSP